MSPRPRARIGPPAACAATALLALAAWALVPRAVSGRGDEPALHLILVDASASVRRPRPSWAAWVRRALAARARTALTVGARVQVVEYAADVRTVFGPGPPDDLLARLTGDAGAPPLRPGSGVREGATDLRGALTVANRAMGAVPRPPGTLIVLGDGDYTSEDPRPELERAAHGLARVVFEGPPPVERHDVALVRLAAPFACEAGAPFAASVEVAWRGPPEPPEIALDVSLERQDGSTWRDRVAVPQDALRRAAHGWRRGVLSVPLPPRPEGLDELAVRVVSSSGTRGGRDCVPENDARSAWIEVGDPLVCLAVGEVPAFAAPGIELQTVSLDALPGRLGNADLVWICDRGPAEWPVFELERFVRDGGGLLACAGWRFLSGWEARGPGAGLLPLLPHPGDTEPRDVILLVDGSGSMAGEPIARVRSAVIELALGALPSDRVSLRFFTGALGDVVFQSEGGTQEERRAALLPLLDAHAVRGPTDVLYTLEQLAALREASERPGLVILLSDGRTDPESAARSRAVRDRLRAAGTRLAVLAVGGRADRPFLSGLLAEGEELVEAGDLSDLARLLQRAVNQDRVREATRLLSAPPGATLGSLARELRDALAAAPGDGPQPLERHVRAVVPEGAETLWTNADGEPVLALQRVGAGWTAALATRPDPAWAGFLASDPGRLLPLLRALGRAHGQRADADELALTLDAGRLVLSGARSGWPASFPAGFFRRTPGPGGGRLLGEVRLALPDPGFAPDVLALRIGPRPAFLERRPVGESLSVALGEGLATLPFRVPLGEELAGGPARRVAAPTAGVTGGNVRDARSFAPARLALPALVGGLVLLALSVLVQGDQGIPRIDRRGP